MNKTNPGMLQKGVARRHQAKMPMVVGCVFFIGLLLGGGGRRGGGVPFLIGLPHYNHDDNYFWSKSSERDYGRLN